MAPGEGASLCARRHPEIGVQRTARPTTVDGVVRRYARACRKNFFGILGTAHARQHRIASGRETRFQTTEGLQQEGTNQKSRPISAHVPGVDPAAGKILGSRSERTDLARSMEKGSRIEGAIRKVVRRGKTQHFGKLFGSTFDGAAPEQGGNYLGGRTGRQTHTHLPATAPRSLPLRECAEAKRNQKGRSGHHLSAEYS